MTKICGGKKREGSQHMNKKSSTAQNSEFQQIFAWGQVSVGTSTDRNSYS